MIDSPRSSPHDLWHRLAGAQDASLAGGSHGVGQETDRAVLLSRRTRRVRPTPLLVTAGALAATVVLGLIVYDASSRVRSDRAADQSGTASRVVLTDARSDLPLQFSDGSSLTFRAGSAGGMQRLGESGADVVLDRGRLDAHVVHADSTLWLIHAGPFKVRVTGTRFTVGWSAALVRLEVAVYQGSVVIDGGALGAGVPLAAGHRLIVENSVVRTDLLAAAIAPAPSANVPGEPAATGQSPTTGVTPAALLDGQTETDGQPVRQAGVRSAGDTSGNVSGTSGNTSGAAPGSTNDGLPVGNLAPPPVAASPALAPPPSAVASHDGDWLPLARRGAYREALATARRLGWSGLCSRLDARRLLMLGDVARYADAPVDAERAFGSLVARYPTHRLAGDALFSLGRLAFEAGRPERAARWFGRYVDDWPRGPLVDQALGRLMESAARTGDSAGARSAAQTYLSRAPNGPHAPLAREVLEEGSSNQQP